MAPRPCKIRLHVSKAYVGSNLSLISANVGFGNYEKNELFALLLTWHELLRDCYQPIKFSQINFTEKHNHCYYYYYLCSTYTQTEICLFDTEVHLIYKQRLLYLVNLCFSPNKCIIDHLDKVVKHNVKVMALHNQNIFFRNERERKERVL